MLLKEKEAKAERNKKRKGRKGRKEGSVRGLAGIVSVMLKNLQLAAGGYGHAQKSSLLVKDWLSFLGKKT
jgi:hypothetical protein